MQSRQSKFDITKFVLCCVWGGVNISHGLSNSSLKASTCVLVPSNIFNELLVFDLHGVCHCLSQAA